MATMNISIKDRAGDTHCIDMLYESVVAARVARDQVLPLINWLMRETAILYYVITIDY